ncbi:MAG: helix-turn-helix transcriptional regulator [Methylococcales bacterium]|nr:helix-turn-helix transcriptional regulator [Methylococcales bacterium]
MSLKIIKPSSLLKPYVIAFWDYENLFEGDNVALSILPDTATYLCFLYADLLTTAHKQKTFTTRSGLAGFQSFRSDLGGFGNISGVSARLTPWGLNVFCRGIVRDCAERRVDCRDIFPRYSIEKTEDNLALKKNAEERVQCVEQFLLSILNSNNEDLLIQSACQELNRSNGNDSIVMLAQKLGLSKRTLERRFQLHIGTTPKKYARIVRLRNALFQRQTLSNWADVAYFTGYYDQSHMINDFQELYGLSPDTLYPQIETSKTIQFSGLLDLSKLAH